jgi:hypothetical protein
MPIGTADIFTADYSSDLGNWGSQSGTTTYRIQARVATAGPQSLDAFEVARVSDVYDGQHYSGHDISLSNYAQGVSRFYRWYEWHDPDNNYNCNTQEAIPEYNGILRHKRIILGDNGGGSAQRMILNVDVDRGGTALPYIGVIFDGDAATETGTFAKNTWVAIQAEVRWSATASYIKVWLNNDTYASPTITHTVGAKTPSGNGYTGFGFYTNNGSEVGGIHTWRDAAFRVATTFDSAWYDWMQNGDGGADTTPPAVPSGVTVS